MSIVLVTGGAGFIGSHLVERLISMGNSVMCVDNFDPYYDPKIKASNLANVTDTSQFELHTVDIRDETSLNQLFQRCHIDTIVHLAARAGVFPSVKDPKTYCDINVRGTLNLLEAAREHNVEKFVFGSSSTVYGVDAKPPFREDANISHPSSPYGASKVAAEQYCHCYSYLFGLPTVVLRFFTVYGPRQRPDMAFHSFAKKILAEEPITLYAEGEAQRDYTYVGDIVDGIVRAISFQCDFEVFNLGNSFTISTIDALRILERCMNKKARVQLEPLRHGEMLVTLADITKAKRMLGYDPKTNVTKGILQFVNWYSVQNREQGMAPLK